MRQIISTGRINVLAVVVGLLTLVTSADVVTVAPEAWRPYLLAVGLVLTAGSGWLWRMRERRTPEALAELMFAAYNRAAGGLTWDKKPIPPWSEIGPVIQSRWVAAASALLTGAASITTQPTDEYPAVQSPRSTRELLDRVTRGSLVLLIVLGLTGCGAARLVSVDPAHAWVEGDTYWQGELHATPGEDPIGDWHGEGDLDTGATVEICVARGKLSRPICTEATLGVYLEHYEDGATLAICWSAVGGMLEDCRVIPLVTPAGEQAAAE